MNQGDWLFVAGFGIGFLICILVFILGFILGQVWSKWRKEGG